MLIQCLETKRTVNHYIFRVGLVGWLQSSGWKILRILEIKPFLRFKNSLLNLQTQVLFVRFYILIFKQFITKIILIQKLIQKIRFLKVNIKNFYYFVKGTGLKPEYYLNLITFCKKIRNSYFTCLVPPKSQGFSGFNMMRHPKHIQGFS